MWTTPEIVSLVVGGWCLLGGFASLAQGFMKNALLNRVFGDEFLLRADAGTYHVGRQAISVNESKRNGLLLLSGAILLLMHQIWNHTWSLAWLVGILAGIGCMRLAAQMVPGTILVLGRSERPTLSLQAQLNASLEPFRAISLLQTQMGDDELLVRSNCLRVGPGDDWVAAVETLCETLPVVVLDLRESTTYVEEEVRIVLEKRYLYKTVFITPEAEPAPIVDRAQTLGVESGPADLACVADAAQCVEVLRRVLLVAKAAPSPARPFSRSLADTEPSPD
jgi:hypothetical protein